MNRKGRTGTSRTAAWILGAVTLALCLSAATASAGTVTTITSFGSNPTGIGMLLYTPSNVAAKPAIVVVPHACHGKGSDVCNSGNAFAQQADKWGFLLVCPSAVSSDGCWDVHSTAVMTHGGGGDAGGIISMVNYVIANNNGDANRVYVAGHSSGGMMTNIMAGSYPDVFKAGAAYAGVPFGCFGTGSVDSLGWNSTCANGNVTKTGTQWGDQVRGAYPGFTGTRPRMQVWHGTDDATVLFANFGEEIKEWTNVLAVSETPTTTENNALQSTWIRTRYTDGAGSVQVEAIQETGQPHNLVVNAAEAIRFFGLDGSNPVPDAGAKMDTQAGTGGASGGTGGTGGSGTGGASGTGGRNGGSGGSGSGGTSTAVGGSGGNRATTGGATGSGGTSAADGGSGGAQTGGNGGNSVAGSGGGGAALAGSGGATATGGGSSGQSSDGGSGGTGAGGSNPSGGGSMAGGSTGSGGTQPAAGSGGSTSPSTGPARAPAPGCSCVMGASERKQTFGWRPIGMLLAFGVYWRARRRRLQW